MSALGTETPDAPPAEAPPTIDFSDENVYSQFIQSLPEDQREIQLAKETKNLHSLFEQTVNAQAALGKKRLEAPSKDWDETKWNDFLANVRPETVDGYELPEKLQLKLEEGGDLQDYEIGEDDASKLKAVAHDLGLSPYQAKKLAEHYAKEALTGQATLDTSIKETVTQGLNALREQWGDNFDLNTKAANEAFEVFVERVPELRELVESSPAIANHPAVLKLFNELNPLIQDLGAPSGSTSSFQNAATVGSIKAQIQDFNQENATILLADPSSLSIADKEKRNRLLEERTRLYQQLHGMS